MMTGFDVSSRTGVLLVLAIVAGTGGVMVLDPGYGAVSAEESRPNIVIVSVDNMRADFLPCYGADRDTAPNICALAEEGFRFENAVSQATWTLPAHASLFLSQYQTRHGVDQHGTSIPIEARTLAEYLNTSGYRTAAFVGNTRGGGGDLKPEYGFPQGFDLYDARGAYLSDAFERARDWLRGETGEPFFLFAHGYDVHAPFGDPAWRFNATFAYDGVLKNLTLGYEQEDAVLDDIVFQEGDPVLNRSGRSIPLSSEDVAYIRDKYAADLRVADRRIGSFLTWLQRSERSRDTIVIVLGMDGTTLVDRRLPGGRAIGHVAPYEETVRSPLVIRVPGAAGGTVQEQVEIIDLMPTLLDIAGTPYNTSQFDGTSFTALLDDNPLNDWQFGEPYAFSEGALDGAPTAVRNPPWKLIEDATGEVELFNIRDDPGETENIASRHPSVVDDLQKHLDAWRTRTEITRSRQDNAPSPKNIILISLTGLRRDHLPCYGYPRDTAPNICRFAEDAAQFENAYSPAIWTMPAYASILTGTYPSVHGAVRREPDAFNTSLATFPAVLNRSGYRTAAFLGAGYHGARYGFGDGFGTYHEVNATSRFLKAAIPPALQWLQKGGSDPFFLFLQGYDIHAPFDPPAPYRDRFVQNYTGVLTEYTLDYNRHDPESVLHRIKRTENGPAIVFPNRTVPIDARDIAYIRARYDGEIAYADAQIGAFLQRLKEQGIYNDTAIILLSEHGETLGQSGPVNERLFGKFFPYEEVIGVPLLIKLPGQPSQTVPELAGLTDIMPTVLNLAALPETGHYWEQVQGKSLLPLLQGEPYTRPYIFAERVPQQLGVIRTQDWKLVKKPGLRMLLDPATNETEDYSGAFPEAASRLEHLLTAQQLRNQKHAADATNQ